jgi:hypothetical protein
MQESDKSDTISDCAKSYPNSFCFRSCLFISSREGLKSTECKLYSTNTSKGR